MQKYILSLIIQRINQFINIKNNKIITIQKHIRGFITYKKYLALKSVMNKNAIFIQKYVRGFLIRTKNKDELNSILETIGFNKMQAEYQKKLKIMMKKRDAIRVIERWWEKILEKRRQDELYEKIKKMPKDCQELYYQFVKLRKHTKSIKNEFNQFAKDKIGFVP